MFFYGACFFISLNLFGRGSTMYKLKSDLNENRNVYEDLTLYSILNYLKVY